LACSSRSQSTIISAWPVSRLTGYLGKRPDPVIDRVE
jgi:hypothetical protein